MVFSVKFRVVRDGADLAILRDGSKIRHLEKVGEDRYRGQLANIWGSGASGLGFSERYIRKSVTEANREAREVVEASERDNYRFRLWRPLKNGEDVDLGVSVRRSSRSS
ncbi:hypothetical protein ACEUZ9_000772 [Paracoccus litorisediminis]|uniref:hypothetical protein n=1 Tax=Paracoccus litorisediminis TaxID=2006130 RepID=UPI00372F0134